MHLALEPRSSARSGRKTLSDDESESVVSIHTYLKGKSLMIYYRKFTALSLLLTTAVVVTLLAVGASADPLPGRDILKFSQQPMDGLTLTNPDGTASVYWGHDELSTAYGSIGPVGVPIYQGRFMADDFADRFNSPVVHVKWWGSYLDNIINPNFPVDKFLISFESDIPANPDDPTSFSRPGTPLLNQIVRRGPLAPGSGTFTETPISPGGNPLFERLYEYNAELHLEKEFPEKRDEVYWLKIVALVDVPSGIPFDPLNPPTDVTRWGWHNRDYTVMNPLASVPPAVVPGERIVGTVPGNPNVPIWHFQDNAVTGIVGVDTAGPMGQIMPVVVQDLYQPTHYLDFIDGPGPGLIPGQEGIGRFSKDLAFELYTVPEPATCLLLVIGLGAVFTGRKRG